MFDPDTAHMEECPTGRCTPEGYCSDCYTPPPVAIKSARITRLDAQGQPIPGSTIHLDLTVDPWAGDHR